MRAIATPRRVRSISFVECASGLTLSCSRVLARGDASKSRSNRHGPAYKARKLAFGASVISPCPSRSSGSIKERPSAGRGRQQGVMCGNRLSSRRFIPPGNNGSLGNGCKTRIDRYRDRQALCSQECERQFKESDDVGPTFHRPPPQSKDEVKAGPGRQGRALVSSKTSPAGEVSCVRCAGCESRAHAGFRRSLPRHDARKAARRPELDSGNQV